MEDIFNILHKQLNHGSLSQSENEKFSTWISSAQNQDIFNDYKKLWKLTHFNENALKPDVDIQWNKFKTTIEKSPRVKVRNIYVIVSGIAAVAIIAIVLSVFIGKFSFGTVTYASQDTPLRVDLPDNSTVFLNKNSTLSISKKFNKLTRSIDFTGEALFEVAKNQNIPFIIKLVDGMEVKVLGTKFNLRTYNTNPEFELKVLSGTVAFGTNEKSVVVEKGNEVSYNKVTQSFSETKLLNSNLLAWHTKKLEFDNTPIQDVKASLERYINKTIELPENTADLRYTGSFDDPTEKEIAEVIALALGWDFKITKKSIVFSCRK